MRKKMLKILENTLRKLFRRTGTKVQSEKSGERCDSTYLKKLKEGFGNENIDYKKENKVKPTKNKNLEKSLWWSMFQQK